MTYVGIGSPFAPASELLAMERIGRRLAEHGWTLWTGLDPGAGQAWYRGASSAHGRVKLYLPNRSHERMARIGLARDVVVGNPSSAAYQYAAELHPRWWRLSKRERTVSARDTQLVLGEGLNEPADLVICWFEESSGEMAPALAAAARNDVPVWNIALPDGVRKVRELLGLVGGAGDQVPKELPSRERRSLWVLTIRRYVRV